MNPRANKSRLWIVHIRAYRIADAWTGPLILLVLVASPWLFGTTQPATIWAMNIVGYVLGGLLAGKWIIRTFYGFEPARWSNPVLEWPVCTLRILTVSLLLYCLVSALNARSLWITTTGTFQYFHYLTWLPHSYDRAGTWQAFWNYSALACLFWATHDWLMGLTPAEEQAQRSGKSHRIEGGQSTFFFPARLRLLLWVLSVNGGLLAAEGIVQRLTTNKLLWLVVPTVHKEAATQFGPYAYRSNAAQYFNLLWPVTLGFWWTLHRGGGFKRWRHHGLLACGLLMAACPIISTTRGGALVAGGILISAALFFLLSPLILRSQPRFTLRAATITILALGIFFLGASWLGIHFGWDALAPRMAEIEQGYTNREQTYETARQLAKDYPLFGTGPGTFTAVFQFYRSSADEFCPVQLHNDWLETRITFGALGSLFIGLALVVVLARWFTPGGIHGGRRFIVLAWFAIIGCLIHALFDFPFQIYSILMLFLTICAVLFTLSRRVTK
jgi:O-antigen ligase